MVRLMIPFSLALVLSAQSADPIGAGPRKIPPVGIRIPDADRAALVTGAKELGDEIQTLRSELQAKPPLLELLPDVQVLHKAVDWALRHDEFYRTNEVQIARLLLQQGGERARALRGGSAPWTTATGLVVRAYVSKIDGSIQPYGLVVPPTFAAGTASKHRLDIWLHGRDDHLTELKFIDDRQKKPGEFTPADAFVLHSYGRYCNAFKFAGEIDVLEAMEHVRKHYPIDENRIALRGFSMGGAGCWHLAVHHAGRWTAAAPGAGFAETALYTKASERRPKPPWYEQSLWHLYDATDYALNLFNVPVIAYSGELDKQKQAADMMAEAMKREGLELTHLIGPKTEHKYEPETKKELAGRVDDLVARGRNPLPDKVQFATWTLRYNEISWVAMEGLEKHWLRARIEAEVLNPHTIRIQTENVTALTLSMPAGLCSLNNVLRPGVELNGQKLEAPRVAEDGSWKARLMKRGDRWSVVHSFDEGLLRKRPGLQGPIDDAFMDSFIMVRPTGEALNAVVGKWVTNELEKALLEWRNQFRGDARVKADMEVTDDNIAANNLVVWGDPKSNRLLARIADKLPVRWDMMEVTVGARTFDSAEHLPVLIYPNPLNPDRYIVLNSGFTFTHPVSSSNADQTSKLPDYAVVDITGPPAVGVAGEVVEAGFFDERWQLPIPVK
jgi:pimeloyl-ACP methyl ester carboxylesterase